MSQGAEVGNEIETSELPKDLLYCDNIKIVRISGVSELRKMSGAAERGYRKAIWRGQYTPLPGVCVLGFVNAYNEDNPAQPLSLEEAIRRSRSRLPWTMLASAKPVNTSEVDGAVTPTSKAGEIIITASLGSGGPTPMVAISREANVSGKMTVCHLKDADLDEVFAEHIIRASEEGFSLYTSPIDLDEIATRVIRMLQSLPEEPSQSPE